MSNRTDKYSKNQNLEDLIRSLNASLELADETVFAANSKPGYPVLLIMGCARSGTTLFLQWLASLGYFWYPSNFVSRFYAAPAVGYQIQRLLTEPQFEFGQELSGFIEQGQRSDLGKTEGWLAPNEFWYFWRHIFNLNPEQVLDANSCTTEAGVKLSARLGAISELSRKPIAMKAMIANWAIRELNEQLPNAVFVHIRRDARFNAQSLLESRVKHTGSESNWYSFEFSGANKLKNGSPISQVAGQVELTNRAISAELSEVAEKRKLVIDYESFCDNPAIVFENIRDRISVHLPEAGLWKYSGVKYFECMNKQRMNNELWRELETALDAYKK